MSLLIVTASVQPGRADQNEEHSRAPGCVGSLKADMYVPFSERRLIVVEKAFLAHKARTSRGEAEDTLKSSISRRGETRSNMDKINKII